ncbi:cytochrome bc complex cytochrome b subunit [Cocleimonas flava]|uniref:Cytochrome b n=1 Tax=Cocleimonas flava TaxID=634765 RepID=A0A4R1ERV0_9GAMM|nr:MULTISPECIES: cytochrome bc complex cytochrome b subunit [Cocleimonas]MEB8433145.1 cytochrome bc complex cytochrome b subunit [Cocleimonas sp. KMM 6892]MEC4715874.1 cytochrome bc complex cytochrome b subunit [Cocleimonas sp. KMM 6895]MEC4745335.1 cytochrome bc complex cytochrome b subunit [Cocleimonas sp. KMM 6896]TCJ82612.1 ubiquinol-cytochrome c reductase cytochrome b subunit [Cocleimonas flava]
MANNTEYKGLLGWVDERFPLMETWKAHMSEYYAPKNFNAWYYFGVLAMLVLVIQIVSGIFLTMHYKPDAELAFASVEYIMRDVPGGWFIRYMHSTGASAFFIVVYFHMFRGLMYGSYKGKRELIWLIGMVIYLALMAEAFMGYMLPWGQMSFWGAQVIINLFNTIPLVGESLSLWIRGDFVISDPTLNRLFAFHVAAVPLILVALVFVHIVALHTVGSNNPDGVEIKKLKNEKGIPLDGVPFHPYYTVHDIPAIVVFLMVFFSIIFFAPEMGGYFLEHANFEPANPLKTPEHIAPVWYFTPFYTVLRAVTLSPFMGTLAMFGAIIMLFLLPWLDRNPIKSWRYRNTAHMLNLAIFAAVFIILGYLGVKAVTPEFKEMGVRMTEIYFMFFAVIYVHSNSTKPGRYLVWFVILAAAVFIIDFIRYNPGDAASAAQIMWQWVWPIGYLALTLLLPYFMKSCNAEKEVPERVTS